MTVELMLRAAAGDRDAYGQVYLLTSETVRGFVARKTGDRTLTEDIVSATYVKGLAAVHRWQHIRPPVAWFLTIASNLISSHFTVHEQARRSDTDYDLVLEYEPDPAPGAGDPAPVVMNTDLIRRAMSVLNNSEREVITLRFIEDLSVEETAARTGRTIGATKAMTFRARARMIAELTA